MKGGEGSAMTCLGTHMLYMCTRMCKHTCTCDIDYGLVCRAVRALSADGEKRSVT